MALFSGRGGWKSRVLIVSGDPRELAELKKELMQSFEVNIAASCDAALAMLKAYGADAIVVCAGGDDVSACSKLIAKASFSSAAVLFLARSDDEGLEAAALAIGGDYAVKRCSGSGALIKRLQLRIRANAPSRDGEPPITQEEALRGKTILIAEDVELNRDILAAILSTVEGLTLDFAEDGDEALEKYRGNPALYSMVFLDIHMPKMDGISVARAIRALPSPEASRKPIFALSASGSESESIRLCEEAGMNGYLQKPVDYDEFLKICTEYITR